MLIKEVILLETSMNEKSMDNLISSVINGDEEAFKILYNSYHKNIYRYILSMINDEKAAEDILQEVFITVYNKIYKLKHYEAFETWLYRITINACNGYFRRNKKITYADSCTLDTLIEFTDSTDPNKQVLMREVYSHLDLCINNLSINLKNAIILFYFQDKSIFEIAKIMDCPINTVKTRLFKAKKHLLKGMESDYELEVKLSETREYY